MICNVTYGEGTIVAKKGRDALGACKTVYFGPYGSCSY